MSESLHEWLSGAYRAAVERNPERRDTFRRSSGDPVQPLYTGLNGRADTLGFPGEFPFTRGIQPTMYRGRLWTMRQYAGQGDAETSNERYRFLLDQGQTGLSVAFDLPTQIGYDSDHPMAAGEVGKVGVAIDSIEDMRTLFREIPLDKVTTSMTINSTASILLALYIAVGEEQGVDRSQLGGTVQNDILKEYVARGTYIYPPGPSIRLITDIFDFCAREVPRWNTISVSGYHMREAGCTAAQEVGFTLAHAIGYIEAALATGQEFDRIGQQVSFFFACHSNFLEEVAKFRAARRLWARITRDRFHSNNPRAQTLRFHTQTGGVTLTAQQPDNNVIRTTIQALAAILGGPQSLHVNSKDEALALPTEESVQLSLRTQQILAYEMGVAETVDPLAGSYYIESLTDEVERKAFEYIEEMDGMGGALSALDRGYQIQEIHESAFRHQRQVESEERVVVGVNRFQSPTPPIEKLQMIERAETQRQLDRLAGVRRERDESATMSTLSRLEEVARGTDNTMPAILECVEAYATLGEISDVFRKVFGEQQEFSPF